MFAGPFAPELPTLTCTALRAAFDTLPQQEQQHVAVARLDMCIFVEDQVAAFEAAFEEEVRLTERFEESLDKGSSPTQPWQTTLRNLPPERPYSS